MTKPRRSTGETRTGAPATVPEHPTRQPILHTPYEEPDRHWEIGFDNTARDSIVSGRRPALAPYTPPRTGPAQGSMFRESPDENWVDELRGEVRRWRGDGWPGTTVNTERLLEWWARPPGEGAAHSPFFAQREAVETIVYLSERGNGSHPVNRRLRELAAEYSRDLLRVAIRMATGTGKTRVMAMLIAWYAVNRRFARNTGLTGFSRHARRIVVICPGTTIRTQLRQLDPRSAGNVYQAQRLVPDDLLPELRRLSVTVVNAEALLPRRRDLFRYVDDGKVNARNLKTVLGDRERPDTETYRQMWDRILGPADPTLHGTAEPVVVLNDEAHHCWDRSEEPQGVWIRAIHELDAHPAYSVRHCIDLSATPIFIDPARTRGIAPSQATGKSRRRETTKTTTDMLFPWVVAEFDLAEAYESGLVKIARVPRATAGIDAAALDNLYQANGGNDSLDGIEDLDRQHVFRQVCETAYADYVRTLKAWRRAAEERRAEWKKRVASRPNPDSVRLDPPKPVGEPVLIVVVNTKRNAARVHELLGGTRRRDESGKHVDAYDPPRSFDEFSNVPHEGATQAECASHGARTIFVCSQGGARPEAGEIAAWEDGAIGVEKVTAANRGRMREILQTVGEPGGAGESVRCVVSVGMLTEGWDCPRVTHIIGYRRFGSQLLCEQTIGRGLRRHDYDNRVESPKRDDETGRPTKRFQAEYTTVVGVPILHAPFEADDIDKPITPPPEKHTVQPVPGRAAERRIWVPDFRDYALCSADRSLDLDPKRVQPWRADKGGPARVGEVRVQGLIGEEAVLPDAHARHPETPLWRLARRLCRYLLAGGVDETLLKTSGEFAHAPAALYVHCLRAARAWAAHPKVQIGDARTLLPRLDDAVHQIAQALGRTGDPNSAGPAIVGIPRTPGALGRTAGAWTPFETALKHIYDSPAKSELNCAACHNRLETGIAEGLETHPEIEAWVRNHGPERFEIPYRAQGRKANYVPDFFARARTRTARNRHGTEILVTPHLVVEGKGPLDPDAEVKRRYTVDWWVPCAEHAAVVERPYADDAAVIWAFAEIRDRRKITRRIDEAIAETLRRAEENGARDP